MRINRDPAEQVSLIHRMSHPFGVAPVTPILRQFLKRAHHPMRRNRIATHSAS
jgi:hypothetical protein